MNEIDFIGYDDWVRFHSDEAFVKQFPMQNVPFPVADPEYCHNGSDWPRTD